MWQGTIDPEDENEMAYLRSEQYVRDRQIAYEWDHNLPPHALEYGDYSEPGVILIDRDEEGWE